MTKVEIEKRGRVAKVHPRVADVLVSRYGYLRRDMQAQPAVSELRPAPAAEQSAEEDAKKAAAAKAKKAAKEQAKASAVQRAIPKDESE